MTQTPSLINQFSQQAALLHSAHAEYDKALAAYRNPAPNPVANLMSLDEARSTLKSVGETWEKLCEELLQAAATSPPPASGNGVLDQMVKFAPEVLESQKICKPLSDEYLASRAANHPDQEKLADIRRRLDPAQLKANGARQKWSELCKELLMSFKEAA